jgi:IMP dehydrogenase
MCTTRIVTGHGIPQLTALEDCAKIRKCGFEDVALIADGGIRNSGDLVKSLAIGADAVILGSLLAGTKETPGEFIEEGGRLYKYYAGMASEHGRASWFDRGKTSFIPEGVSTKVPFEGKAAYKVIENLIGGLRSGMSYANATSIQELRENAIWMRVTAAGYQEGTPHGKRG